MSSRKDGIMIVLSSPSGAGKTTLVKLLSKNKNNSVSISYTTRKPRLNEKNKRDYFFVSQNMVDLCNDADIHDDILGSDHCPVSLDLDC